MASLQDIRRRIRSVQNTRKITRALELVAASKLRRAQQRIEDMRPYADRMLELTERMHASHGAVREKIAGGDWSDEIQKQVDDAVAAFAEDFGYDLDEEGEPLEEATAAA